MMPVKALSFRTCCCFFLLFSASHPRPAPLPPASGDRGSLVARTGGQGRLYITFEMQPTEGSDGSVCFCNFATFTTASNAYRCEEEGRIAAAERA